MVVVDPKMSDDNKFEEEGGDEEVVAGKVIEDVVEIVAVGSEGEIKVGGHGSSDGEGVEEENRGDDNN